MSDAQPPPNTAATSDPLPELIRGLRDVAPADRLRAARDLGRLGWLAREALPALSTLIAHLQHTDPFVRGESALAIGWMGPPARSAVPFLAQVVRGRGRASLGLTSPAADTPAPARPPKPEGVWTGDSDT